MRPGQCPGIRISFGALKDLQEAAATEEAAVKNFGDCVAAKKQEVAALSSAIEEKTVRVGDWADLKEDTMANQIGFWLIFGPPGPPGGPGSPGKGPGSKNSAG